MQANPDLLRILQKVCGDVILDDPAFLARFADHANDSGVQSLVDAAKHRNKVALSKIISSRLGLRVDPNAIFDVQIKRVHEYKRQLLNLLETVALYDAIRADPDRNWVPRVKIFAGKAAASYTQAKLIIRLINDVGKIINSDTTIRDLLRVAYLPDYNVSLAEAIIPAADLSEQISTAGMEASGTGNMKLALNGALTIGTLDGANIEIREHVGEENIFIFGLKAHEVEERRRQGLDASAAIAASPRLADVLTAIEQGVYSPDEQHRFSGLSQGLRYSDYYMVTADFDDYYQAQRNVEKLWRSKADWTRASMLNIARMAWFSSDRAIGEYAREIWNVPVEAAKPQ
jgi:starch phosphorylase